MRQMIDRESVGKWLAGYETAWRAPGADGLAALFTSDAVYSQSPYEQPVTGLDAIKRMWEEEREDPDEVSTNRWRWSGLRSTTEIRLTRSTATCGSSGSPVTAVPPGSRNGRTGQATPTWQTTTRHSQAR